MNIYYLADLESRNFEGRTAIALKIKDHLEKRGYYFTTDPEKADVIHVHSSGVLDSFTAYKLKKKYNLPCIFTLYSIGETEPINHVRNFITQKKIAPQHTGNFLASYSAIVPIRWRSLFLQKLDRIIVASSYSADKLKGNVKIIHFGIDQTKFKPLPKKSTEDPSLSLNVGFFGHPAATKGITDYITASKYFPKGIITHLFASRITPELKSLAKKYNPEIVFHEFVENINKAYNEMEIIVLPYRNSLGAISNPLVLLEAMATEAAIVTTNIPFIKEIVQDTALTIPPYSPKEIAKAVTFLAQNQKLREELGKKARTIILKSYREDNMLQQYENIYQEIIPWSIKNEEEREKIS